MPLFEGGTDGGQRRSHRACPEAGRICPPGHGAAEDRIGCRRQAGRRGSRAAAGGSPGSPRAWAAALGLARSLARWLAGRRPPASAGVEVTTRRVTVVRDADTSVLVHRVEMALVVRTLGGPAVGPPTRSNARAARDNRGKRAPSSTALSCRLPHVRRPPGSSPTQRFGMVAGRDPSPPSTRGLDRSRPHRPRHAPRLGRHGQRVSQAPSPGYRCTTGQVRVRVTPLMAWIRDTTS
jgi:hypothetical protein